MNGGPRERARGVVDRNDGETHTHTHASGMGTYRERGGRERKSEKSSPSFLPPPLASQYERAKLTKTQAVLCRLMRVAELQQGQLTAPLTASARWHFLQLLILAHHPRRTQQCARRAATVRVAVEAAA